VAADDQATFTIDKITATAENKTARIHFTEKVDFARIQGNFSVVPPATLYWWDSSIDNTGTLILHGDFQYGATYVISIPKEFEGQPGHTYRKTLNTFTIPDLPPSLEFASKQTVIERDSRQMVHLDLVNVSEVLFEGIRIPPILLPMAREIKEPTETHRMNKLDADCKERMTKLSASLAAREEFKPFLGETVYESHLFFSVAKKNIKTAFSVPLTFREQKQKGGLEFIRFMNNKKEEAGRSLVRLYRVTDLSLAYKLSHDSLLVWATSLGTGKPVAGVSLLAFDSPNQVYSLGKTNTDGFLEVKDRTELPYADLSQTAGPVRVPLLVGKVSMLAGATADDCTYIDLSLQTNPEVTGIVRTAALQDISKTTNAHLFTERGVYRPGETVHFKATLRQMHDGVVAAPKSATYEVEITDSKNESAYSEELALSEFGTLYDDLDLAPYDPLGMYTIHLKNADPGPNGPADLATTTFQVQEFQPPRHHAEIRFHRETRKNTAFVNREREEEVVVATLAGRYYSGGPVKHGQVRWKIYSSSTDFSPKGFSDYSFGSPLDESVDFIDSGESILDESGEVQVPIPLGKEVLAGKHGLKITATVVDFDGRTASQTDTYQVQPDCLVGLSTHTDSVEAGDPLTQRIVVLDHDGKILQQGTVEVTVFERSYQYTRKRNEDGNAFYTYSDVWRKQYASPVPINEGVGKFEFDFNQGGKFLVECAYNCPSGQTSVSGTFYEVNGPYSWYSEEESNTPVFEKVRLLTDKPEYAVGETIHLRIKSQKPMASCLFTIERDGILEHRLVTPEAGEVAIPVTGNFRPNVYLSVLGTLPRGDFPAYQSEFDSGAPKLVFGATHIRVRNSVEPLKVSVGPETGAIEALPGDEMTLDLKAVDSAGKGVAAELAVAVVDEQVLALTQYKTPTLESLLNFTIPLSVFTGETRFELQNQTPYGELRNEPLTGGGGGLEGEAVGLSIREDFNPVPFFDPAVHTGEDGKTQVTFRFADTMTTYRIFVVACDKGGRFATVERPAKVVKKFYLEPGLPRFLTRGDEFRFSVAAFNKTDHPDPVAFEATGTPEVSLHTTSQTYPSKPFDRILIPVEGKAEKTGSAQLTFSGTLAGEKDAVRNTIPVHSGLLLQRDIRYETFSGSTKVVYEFPTDVSAIPSDGLSAKDLSFILTLSGSPFLRMAPGLRYLLDYPYGCIEQTSSRVLPLAALRSLISNGLIPGMTAEVTDKFIKKGIERLLGMQTESGGFAYWPGQQKPDGWGTLYALAALIAVDKVEAFAEEEEGADETKAFDIPEGRLESALSYLSEEMVNTNSNGIAKDGIARGMAVYLLAEGNHLSDERFHSVWNDFDNLGREGRLCALLAAHESGLAPAAEISEKARKVLDGKEDRGDGGGFRALSREPALALLVAAKILPNESVYEKFASQLLSEMKSEGRWSSTSDTGWALLALGEYYKGRQFSEKAVEGHVKQLDAADQYFRVSGAESYTLALEAKKFLEKPSVEISLKGKDSLTYQLELTYPRMDYEKEGYSHGFTLSKKLENTAGTPAIHVGDVVKVTVQIGVDQPGVQYLVLDDPLPAGLVAINSALANEEPVEGLSDNEEDGYYRYWDNDGFYRLVPNFFEFRDDRVLVFRDWVWKGVSQYTYYARAVCAGTFRMPSTKVQLMYTPEECAYTAETVLKIEER
jgi:hypothetical protein